MGFAAVWVAGSSLVVVGAWPVRMSLGAAVTACGGGGGGCLLFRW